MKTYSESQPDWIKIGLGLARMSEIWTVFRKILKQEIDQHNGSFHGFAKEAGLNRTMISRLFEKTGTMGGYKTLEQLNAYCGKRHPELESLILELMELRDSGCFGLGAVSLSEPKVISLWAYIMDKAAKFELHRKNVAAHMKNGGDEVYFVMITQPSRADLVAFENNFTTIEAEIMNMDWEMARANPKEFLPTTKATETARPSRPRRRKGKKGRHVPQQKDMPEFSTEATEFRQVADRCLNKYRSKSILLKACEENGIVIGRTSFSEAYNKGIIRYAAQNFIKFAPERLLNQKVNPVNLPQVIEDDVIKEPQLNSQNYQPHNKSLAESEDFMMVFEGVLQNAINFVNLSAQASPEQREKLIARFRGKMSELSNGLQALRARNPIEVLDMLTGTNPKAPVQSGRRSRGSRSEI